MTKGAGARISIVDIKTVISITDINLSIDEGEFVSLVGPSGAGKTTLLKILLTEEEPTEGSVHFDGINIHNLRPADIPKYRQRIGVVFQDFKLLPDKTAYENISFAMEVAGRSDAEIAADVPHVLDLVDLGKKAWNFPHELSGGERQRVAIARAIINQPDLLIADEPTGNLDTTTGREIMALFDKLHAEGHTVIVVTHEQHIAEYAERIIHILDGKIEREERRSTPATA